MHISEESPTFTRDIQIMMLCSDLEFDKMEIDLEVAKKYIEANKSEFHSIGVKDKGEHMFDAAQNKIYCSDYDKSLKPSDHEIRKLDYYNSLQKLASSIRNKIDLFAQLEFLIRQRPIETTTLELNMIMKYLNCQVISEKRERLARNRLVMKNESPLIDLGCIAPLLELDPAVDIVATENTAVVCYLFTKLCHSVGFDKVNLAFLKNEHVEFNIFTDISKDKVLEGGCIGVVTTQSDVDSAVDVFLNAPSQGLCGFRRILVQESAIERLKSEFAWKTRQTAQVNLKPDLKSLCTDLYVHEDKMYLLEYVGDNTNLRNVILIESFRTVKELLTLIEIYSPFCVSLWSDSVSKSNEIAFGITAPMVWVNRYGNMGDPYQVSLAYFSRILLSIPKNNPGMEEVRALQKNWLKLTFEERRSKTINALISLQSGNVYLKENYLRILYDIESQTCTQKFVHIGTNYLLIGVRKLRDVYAIHPQSAITYCDEFIKCLVDGSGFLMKSNPLLDNTVFAELAKAGLPIHLTNSDIESDPFPLAHTVRVVHSSFGTIFAN